MTTATQQKPRNLTPNELGGVVRAFREMRGWSQEQLAEISGLSARTIQRVEEAVPSSLDTRRALAVAFGFEDVDAFNKPYVIPTAEEIALEKERFDKEHVTLKAASVESGKELAALAAGCNAWMFSEGVELSGPAEEAFAGLSDYCRDYAECRELYSATDRLGVHEELDTYLTGLAAAGICLAAATRSGSHYAQDAAFRARRADGHPLRRRLPQRCGAGEPRREAAAASCMSRGVAGDFGAEGRQRCPAGPFSALEKLF